MCYFNSSIAKWPISLFPFLFLTCIVFAIDHQNDSNTIREITRNKRTLLDEPINFSKLENFWGPSGAVKFFSVVLSTNLIVASGWLISGIIWSALVSSSSTSDDVRRSLLALDFLFSPQSVALNIFRCFVAFVLLSMGIIIKTTLTIGLHETMRYFLKFDNISKMTNTLISYKYLRGAMGRGIMAGIFQIIGFSMLGIIGGSFKRKRRKRYAKEIVNKTFFKNPKCEIEIAFQRILHNLNKKY